MIKYYRNMLIIPRNLIIFFKDKTDHFCMTSNDIIKKYIFNFCLNTMQLIRLKFFFDKTLFFMLKLLFFTLDLLLSTLQRPA
jgi:hypothetical protein